MTFTIRALAACFAIAALGCGSSDEDDTGGAGPAGPGASGSGAAGVGGAGGSGGEGAGGYTGSPCWGNPGTTELFSHETNEFIEVAVTCRAEGDDVLVWVEDALYETQITQAMVDAYTHALDVQAPEGALDPTTGIYDNAVAAFGEVDKTDLPGNKLSVFVVDTDGYGDGYIPSLGFGWADYLQIHIDGAVRPLDDQDTLSVTSHELVHVIEQSGAGKKDPWLSESLGEAGMTVAGYFTDDEWLADWLGKPDINWGPGVTEHGAIHYGGCLLFGSYLAEQLGPAGLRAIVASPEVSWGAVDAGIAAAPDSGFASALELWDASLLAGWFASANDPYRFDFTAVAEPASAALVVGTPLSGTVAIYGVDYLVIPSGAGTVALDASSAATARAVVGTRSGDQVSATTLLPGDSHALASFDAAVVAVTSTAGGPWTVTASP